MVVKFGDLIEIGTNKGLAYALYTHRHDEPPRYGALLRVLDGLYAARPNDLSKVVQRPIRFNTFFPLQAAVNQGIVEVVGNVEIPETLRAFPVFRSGFVNPKTKKVESWYLWNGKDTWQIGALTPEQRKLSIEGVCNDTYLIRKIEEGWSPETDPR